MTDSPSHDRWSFLFAPVDIAGLCVFRLSFGLIMAAWAADYLLSGRVGALYVAPRFHFTYTFFDWIHPWPGPGMYFHFVALFVLALCIAAGFFYRIASVLFAVGFTYFFLLERTNYQNQYYLLLLLSWCLPLLPLERLLSLDAVQRPKVRGGTAPAWALWLVRFHVALPYVFGGVAKFDADWLSGAPLRQFLETHAASPVIGPLVHDERFVTALVWGGLVFDLAIVPLLLWKPSRIPAYAACVCFHVANSFLFRIHVFPWFMIFASTIFFDPSWPHRRPGLFGSAAEPAIEPTPRIVPLQTGERALSCRARWGVALAGVYCLFHILWPLRHHLYPGHTGWTERGHLFSWRMMLRGKISGVRYYLTDTQTGATWHPNLRGVINADQAGKFSRDPEMVLDLAHYLARDYRRRNGRDVEVRALVLTSLNGRKPELLIDPSVDLAQEPRGLSMRPWIMPQTEPLPERPWNVPLVEWERHVELPPLPVVRQPVRVYQNLPASRSRSGDRPALAGR
jgi:vitamin K-dependent gamma-carboxylase